MQRSFSHLKNHSKAISRSANFAARGASTATSKESYTERQAKLGRPISPHVTIYKFPVAALTSITNRATGVALSAGVTGFGVMALAGMDPSVLMNTIGNTDIVGPVAKLAVSFPLVYHYIAGIRHIAWDKYPEKFIHISEVNQSNYLLIGSSGAICLGLACIGGL